MLKYVLDPKDLPEYLYKFRVFEDPNHVRILTHNQLFFPSPKRFNDPFDSTIPVRYDEGSREEIINHWISHLKITRARLSAQEMEAEATKLFVQTKNTPVHGGLVISEESKKRGIVLTLATLAGRC